MRLRTGPAPAGQVVREGAAAEPWLRPFNSAPPSQPQPRPRQVPGLASRPRPQVEATPRTLAPSPHSPRPVLSFPPSLVPPGVTTSPPGPCLQLDPGSGLDLLSLASSIPTPPSVHRHRPRLRASSPARRFKSPPEDSALTPDSDEAASLPARGPRPDRPRHTPPRAAPTAWPGRPPP